MIVGITLTMWASGVTGCTNNRGGMVNVQDAIAKAQAKLQKNSTPANAGAISGQWICIDSGCPKDTIKSISPKLSTIETTLTERLNSANPQSICRMQQTEALTITAQSDALTVKGTLSHDPARLMPALENTHDCEDVLAKINEIKPEATQVILAHDSDNEELLINGVRYRRLSDQELKTINASHYELNADYASIAGDWSCIDEGCGELSQTITPDLKKMTSSSTIELTDDGEKCHVAEDSTLEVKDSSDPQKIYLNRNFGKIKVVDSADNMSDCDAVVKNFNDDRAAKNVESEQITVERDGNQEIILLGKRYVRKG